MIKWLHISDIHYRNVNFGDEILKEKMIDKLENYDKKNEIKYVFLTGDIAFRGEYDSKKTKNFIKSILSVLGLTEKNLFIVPGNHDLKRNSSESVMNNTKKIMSEKEPDKYVNDKLNDTDLNLFLESQKLYFDMYEELKGEKIKSELHFVEITDDFNIIHLNTSWFCQINSKKQDGKLVIASGKLWELKDKIDTSKKSIAIGHHQLDLFDKYEKKLVVYLLKELNVIAYLCGHTHDNAVIRSDICEFVSGSIKDNDWGSPTFSICGYYKGNISHEYFSFIRSETAWNDCDVNVTNKVIGGKGEIKLREDFSNREDFQYKSELKRAEYPINVRFEIKTKEQIAEIITRIKEKLQPIKCVKNISESEALIIIIILSSYPFKEQANYDDLTSNIIALLTNKLPLQVDMLREFSILIREEYNINNLESTAETMDYIYDFREFCNGKDKYDKGYILVAILYIIIRCIRINHESIIEKTRESKYFKDYFFNLNIGRAKCFLSNMLDIYTFYSDTSNFQGLLEHVERNKNTIIFVKDEQEGIAALTGLMGNGSYCNSNNLIMNINQANLILTGTGKEDLEVFIDQLRLFSINLFGHFDMNNTNSIDFVSNLENIINKCEFIQMPNLPMKIYINMYNSQNTVNDILLFMERMNNEKCQFIVVMNASKNSNGNINFAYNLEPITYEDIINLIDNKGITEEINTELKRLYLQYTDFHIRAKVIENLIGTQDISVSKFNDIVQGIGSYKISDEIIDTLNNIKDSEALEILQFISSGISNNCTIDDMQLYLEANELYIKKPVLLSKLDSIKDIIGIDGNVILPKDPDISNYVIKNYFSKFDSVKILENIYNWLEKNSGFVDTKTIINRVIKKYFKDASFIEFTEIIKQYTNKFIENILRNRNFKMIFRFAVQCYENSLDEQYENCINLAIDNNYYDANLYYVINKIEEDESNATNENIIGLLKAGINDNHTKSKVLYSQIQLKYGHDYDYCEKLLEEALETGDVIAKMVLAILFIKTEKHLDRAERLLEKTTNKIGFASYILGVELIEGRIFRKDIRKGVYYLEKAIEDHELIDAYIFLGYFYIETLTEYKNISRGIELMNYVFSIKPEEVSGYLGSLYAKGDKVHRNPMKSLEYLNISIEANDIRAMKFLGWAYFEGKYFISDKKKSFNLFYKAYLLGDNDARDFLLDGLLFNEYRNVSIDRANVHKLIDKEKENENSKALTFYIIDLFIGEYYDRDIELSNRLFNKERDGLSVDLVIQYAFALISFAYTNDDFEKGLEILSSNINKSDRAKRYYSIALIKKYEKLVGNRNREKYMNIAIRFLNDLSLEDDYPSKYALAKLYIRKKWCRDKYQEGIDLFNELIEYNEEIYLPKYVKLLLREENGQEILNVISRLEESEFYMAKILLNEIYLSPIQEIYNLEKAENNFEKHGNQDNIELMISYGIELLSNTKLKFDEAKGLKLLDEGCGFGSGRAEKAKIKYYIYKGEFSKIKTLVEKNRHLTTEDKNEIGQKIISMAKTEEELNYGLDLVEEASENSKEAREFIALEYIKGLILPANREKGIKMLQSNINLGHSDSSLSLAKLYLEGIWLKQDFEKALHYTEIKNLENTSLTNYIRGRIYYSKSNPKRSEAKARKCFNKSRTEINYEFLVAVRMKNNIGFKPKYRGAGLTMIEEFKKEMYSDYYVNFGVMAYQENDIDLSIEFTKKAFRNKNIPLSMTPYVNLFYLYRRHMDDLDLSNREVKELFDLINKDNSCLELFNYIFYSIKLEGSKFDWRKYDDYVACLLNPVASIEWWGSSLYESPEKMDKAESNIVIGWLKKHKLLGSSEFKKDYRHYFNEAKKNEIDNPYSTGDGDNNIGQPKSMLIDRIKHVSDSSG